MTTLVASRGHAGQSTVWATRPASTCARMRADELQGHKTISSCFKETYEFDSGHVGAHGLWLDRLGVHMDMAGRRVGPSPFLSRLEWQEWDEAHQRAGERDEGLAGEEDPLACAVSTVWTRPPPPQFQATNWASLGAAWGQQGHSGSRSRACSTDTGLPVAQEGTTPVRDRVRCERTGFYQTLLFL